PEAAEQLGLHAGHLRHLAIDLEPLREPPRRAHRPHGVRARWPDADLEDVEDRDVHAWLVCHAITGSRRQPAASGVARPAGAPVPRRETRMRRLSRNASAIATYGSMCAVDTNANRPSASRRNRSTTVARRCAPIETDA